MAEETKETTGCVDGDCENGTGTYIFKSGNKYGNPSLIIKYLTPLY